MKLQKKSVDQTADKFDSHVAEKKEEAINAISEHAEAAKTAAESVINDAKDAGVSAVNTASETGVNNVNSAQTEGVAAVNAAVEEGKKNFETDKTLELSGCAADAAVTGAKINDLKKDIYFSKRPIGQPSAIISFIDDDCRIETYNKILPLMKESKVPWGIACPVGQLGTDTFMSVDQLKEMIAAGATVLSHHQKQYAMNQFQNRTEYENELSRADAAFKAIGLEPKSICYPNGICVDGYMDIVKDHYDYGFTVDRGVNTIPLESLFLKRVEVFPTSEIYTFDDVKKYVDNIKDGEWLIFMTHAWYTTFDSAKLIELINYVKNKSISIVSVDEGMSRVGNLEEHGIIKKPLEYMSTPFYCVDKTGVIHTNNQKFYQKSNEKLTNINPGWNAGYNLTVNGATPAASSKSRLVSVKVTVKPGETYLISASNVYGNALYCIYDESDVVITYEASENTADGTVITKKRITIPENASYMKIASNIAAQPGGYEILKVESVAVDYDFVPADEKVVSQLKENLSNKITKFYASNQGETHITDSDNGKIQDMMIYGKSSQDGTPSPDNPVEIKSVVNPTIKVCGKNLLQPNLRYRDRAKINIKKDVKLTLICKNGTVSKGGNLKFEKANGELVWFGFDKGSVKQQIMLYSDVVAYTYLFDSEPSESYALYIGDENTYEPYKEQSMQLHITLNAIPVSSGGNVTINGQQYIADYVDVERGKIVRNIGIANQEDFTVTQKDDRYVAFVNYTADTKGGIGSATTITNGYSPSWEAIENISHHFTQSNSTQRLIIILAKGTTLERANEIKKNGFEFWYTLQTPIEEELTTEQVYALKELATRYPVTNISVTSDQLDGYTVFNYPISMAEGWNYVKQQINDNRDYIYDMDAKTQDIDIQSAEAYVNSEYAVALTELEVM